MKEEVPESRVLLTKLQALQSNLSGELATLGQVLGNFTDDALHNRDTSVFSPDGKDGPAASDGVISEYGGLVGRLRAERDELARLLQAEILKLRDVDRENGQLSERLALLGNRLRQRGEENEQVWANFAQSERELTELRAQAEDHARALQEANQWVFRLAGERKALSDANARLERDYDIAQSRAAELQACAVRHERALACQAAIEAALRADLDHARASWARERASSDQATAAHLTQSAKLAEREGLLRALQAEMAAIKKECEASTTLIQTQRHQIDRVGAEAQVGIREANVEREVALRKLEWLTRVHAAQADFPFWWQYLPGALRRHLQHRRLARLALFDARGYRQRYADAVLARCDPLDHFVRQGLGAGQIPF
jgi:DNA repair exonuclease SbcCD ATPase subunit